MIRLVALLCCVLWAVSLQAAGLVISKDGYYLVEQNADGSAKMTKFTPGQIIFLDAPTPQPPPDTPTPPPGSTPLSEKVAGWAKQVNDPVGAAVLQLAYRTVGQQIAAGNIPPNSSSVDKVLTPVLDAALANVPESKPKWKGFRDKVATELATRLVANGGVMNAEQYLQFFNDVASGLGTANVNYAIPPWLAELLAALIPIIIQLITRLISGIG